MPDFLDENYGTDTIEMGATIAASMVDGQAKFGAAIAAIQVSPKV